MGFRWNPWKGPGGFRAWVAGKGLGLGARERPTKPFGKFWLVVSLSFSVLASSTLGTEPARAEPSEDVSPSSDPEDDFVEALLVGSNEKLRRAHRDAAQLRLQVLVSEVQPESDGRARLVRHGFRVDEEYFYPASAIKPFAAVAALQSLRQWAKEAGEDRLAATTPFRMGGLSEAEGTYAFDGTNRDGGRPTVAHEIRKALIFSDNDAHNRLFSVAGHGFVHEYFWDRGYGSLRMVHRLGWGASTPEAARVAPPVDFLVGSERTISIGKRVSSLVTSPPEVPGLFVGNQVLTGEGRLLAEPMSFVTRNRVALGDLQDLLVQVVRPDLETGKKDLNLVDEDRQSLVEVLGVLPRESKNPIFVAPPDDLDRLHKPLVSGALKVVPKERLRFAGKSGRAYGFTVDNVYLEDRASGRALFATAAIYTNPRGILNDDSAYDYGAANAFFADFGELLGRYLGGETKEQAASGPTAVRVR